MKVAGAMTVRSSHGSCTSSILSWGGKYDGLSISRVSPSVVTTL